MELTEQNQTTNIRQNTTKAMLNSSDRPIEAPIYDEPILVSYATQHDLERKYGIYARYQLCSFDILQPQEADKMAFQKVKAYADNLEWNLANGCGLILKGSIGTGKTSLAVAVMKEAIAKKKKAYFIPMVSLLDRMMSLKDGEERARFENTINQCDLLVIDDLGSEYVKSGDSNSWALNKIESMIVERYNRMKSIIITTNLPIDSKDRNNTATLKGRYNNRIIDRLRSTSEVVNFVGRSLRTKEWDKQPMASTLKGG